MSNSDKAYFSNFNSTLKTVYFIKANDKIYVNLADYASQKNITNHEKLRQIHDYAKRNLNNFKYIKNTLSASVGDIILHALLDKRSNFVNTKYKNEEQMKSVLVKVLHYYDFSNEFTPFEYDKKLETLLKNTFLFLFSDKQRAGFLQSVFSFISKKDNDRYETPEMNDDRYETPEMDLDRYETPEMDLDRYETPEMDNDRYETPEIDIDRYETPEMDVDRYETPEMDNDLYETHEMDLDILDELEYEHVINSPVKDVMIHSPTFIAKTEKLFKYENARKFLNALRNRIKNINDELHIILRPEYDLQFLIKQLHQNNANFSKIPITMDLSTMLEKYKNETQWFIDRAFDKKWFFDKNDNKIYVTILQYQQMLDTDFKDILSQDDYSLFKKGFENYLKQLNEPVSEQIIPGQGYKKLLQEYTIEHKQRTKQYEKELEKMSKEKRTKYISKPQDKPRTFKDEKTGHNIIKGTNYIINKKANKVIGKLTLDGTVADLEANDVKILISKQINYDQNAVKDDEPSQEIGVNDIDDYEEYIDNNDNVDDYDDNAEMETYDEADDSE